VGWPTGAIALTLLTILCMVIGWALPALLNRRRWVLPLALVMVLVVVRPLPTPNWPPPGWVMVMCDVGQGDGLVLNAGPRGVVVVDTGPDPEVIDACLDRLEVERVVTVVLSHFHADHVGGLPGVLAERPPARLLVTGFAEPAENAAEVRAQAARAGVPMRVPEVGTLLRVGPLTLQVLGPAGRFATGTARADGSPANNASLTLLAQTRGVRILLPGDSEPEAQEQLVRTFPHLRVDVLKVPHHGSSYQSTDFLTGLGARVALVPVGAENSYGHPAPRVLDLLEDAGALVRRTDQAGDVAVVVGADGQLTLRELSTSSSAMR
jgi:competence protein ComEC